MTTLQRSAAICGALLALPIAAVVVFRARDRVEHFERPSDESRATAPAPRVVSSVEQPGVAEAANEPTPVIARAAPVVAPVPAVPRPDQVRDYAVGADEHRGRAEVAHSDPAGVERPARLELGALSRSTEDPQAEEP